MDIPHEAHAHNTLFWEITNKTIYAYAIACDTHHVAMRLAVLHDIYLLYLVFY